MFAPALSVSTTEAGTRRPIVLDSRLRGNDMGVEFIQTYQGIFVATTFGYNRHVVMLNLFQHPEIPKQVRNNRGVSNSTCHLPAAPRRMRMLHVRTGLAIQLAFYFLKAFPGHAFSLDAEGKVRRLCR